MLSRIQLGAVARDYLQFRRDEVAHFDRNASYIKPFVTEGVHLFFSGHILEIEIDCFCEDLAQVIFKDSQRIHADLLCEDTFLELCYTLAKYILYKEGIKVGETLMKEVAQVAQKCTLPTELVVLFFRTVSEEIWLVLE